MPNSDIGSEDHHVEEKKVESINIAHQENQSTQVSTKGCELENAKAEMGEIRRENQRLKLVLQHINKDYQSLQLRFFDIVKQEDPKKLLTTDNSSSTIKHDHHDQTEEEEAELVSLSLGRSPRSEAKNVHIVQDRAYKNLKGSNIRDEHHDQDHHDDLKANLTLGLGSEMQLSTEFVTFPSPENSISEEPKELAEPHVSNGDHDKSQKTRNGDDHEVSHEQPPAKRARVSVRARCDTPTMNDGCQWRKYGQKIAKGNPCPRAYYRCTVAPSCPVRKQVQRCAEDMSILTTTYEGTHNHPLPVTATFMASTTSAAASMLLSGSSTSSDHPTNVGLNTASPKSAPSMLNGLNFGHFDTMRTGQFYLPNSTNSSSPLLPTITLDLTSSPISSSSSSSPPSLFNRSSLPSSLARIPSSGLSFSNYSEPNILPTLWGNGSNLGYGNTMLMPYENALQIGSSLNIGKQANPLHESLTETLTKAITSDPGAFKSVIAAAISSMVGGRETLHGKQDGVERLGQGLTLGDQNGKGLASSYFNRLSSSNF